jgi:predicted acyl esterase
MGSSASNPSDGVWTVTPPAPHDLRYAGEPELTVEVETQVPFANLIAVLYDIAPDGTAHMISRGAYRLPGNGEVGFVLYPQDGILEEGHRLGLHISGDSHFQPTWTQTDVTVTGGSLSLPFLTYERVYDLEGGPARAMTGVPQASVDQGTIEAAEVDFDFPPPMIACDDETQDCPQE